MCLLLFTFFSLRLLLLFLDISVLHKVRAIPVFPCFVYTFCNLFTFVLFGPYLCLYFSVNAHARLFIDDGSGDDDDEAAAAAAAEAVIFIYGH